jgi:hypothetical protein
MGKIAKMDFYPRSKMKIVVWVLQPDAARFFSLDRGYLKTFFVDYAVRNNLLASEIWSTKVRI